MKDSTTYIRKLNEPELAYTVVGSKTAAELQKRKKS